MHCLGLLTMIVSIAAAHIALDTKEQVNIVSINI